MPTLLIGIVVLLFWLWALHAFARTDPKKLVPIVRTSGGIGALAGAAFLAARGQFGLAVPLGFAGLSLLGWIPGAASFSAPHEQEHRARCRACARPLSKWSSTTTPARCAARILAAGSRTCTLDALDVAGAAAAADRVRRGKPRAIDGLS